MIFILLVIAALYARAVETYICGYYAGIYECKKIEDNSTQEPQDTYVEVFE